MQRSNITVGLKLSECRLELPMQEGATRHATSTAVARFVTSSAPCDTRHRVTPMFIPIIFHFTTLGASFPSPSPCSCFSCPILVPWLVHLGMTCSDRFRANHFSCTRRHRPSHSRLPYRYAGKQVALHSYQRQQYHFISSDYLLASDGNLPSMMKIANTRLLHSLSSLSTLTLAS